MTRLLQRFFNVRTEEVGPILLALLHFFCILTALMVLRPAREALGMQRGIEAIRWLFMGTLVLTLLVNPVFGLLVSQFRRFTFIALTHGFFALNLVGFHALLVLTPQAIGVTTGQVFYVWMSVFNLFVTMVFWALMADRFTLEQSKRLFGLIAVGGTAGAITGSSLAALLVDTIGTPALLLVAAGFLAAATAAAWGVTRLRTDRRVQLRTADGAPTGPGRGPAPEDRAIIGGSAWAGFRAVARSPYLLGISGYVLILAVMVTFVYFTRLQMVAELGEDVDMRTGIFARIDLITQTATLLLQAIVAGHVMRRLGVHVALAMVPLIVAAGFIGLAAVGTLAALVAFDATFRAVQRAIMRPARETLFTVVSREDKYKSKAFIDTFVYRGGDAVGAQVEGVLGRIGLGLAALATFAVPLAIVWAGLGIWLGLQQRSLAPVPAPRDVAGAAAGPR
jgi:ATP:ADP antiporter, AAA family